MFETAKNSPTQFFNGLGLVAGWLEWRMEFEFHIFYGIIKTMISFISGTIDLITDKFAVINTGSIGYRVFVNKTTLTIISKQNQEVKLYTFLNVKEDELSLYGFLKWEELEFFELLNSISGVGPKSALAILDLASVEDLKGAIVHEKTDFLTKVSGVGRKTAQRIILELKSKISKIGGQVAEFNEADLEALEALQSLGYKVYDAREALKRVPSEITNTSERIRQTLKVLGKK